MSSISPRHLSGPVVRFGVLLATLCVAATLVACVGEREDVPGDTSADTAQPNDTSVSDTAGSDTTVGQDTATPQDTSIDTAEDTGDATDTSVTDTEDADTTTDDADMVVDVTGPATVSIIPADGQVTAGILVAAHRADGSVLGTAVTNSDGIATIDVVDGGWITADAAGVLGERMLISIAGVARGDAIELGRAEPIDDYLGDIQVLVDFANYPDIDHVFVSNGCDVSGRLATQDTAFLPLFERCAHPEVVGMPRAGQAMGWGFDANGTLVQTTVLPQVSLGSTPRLVSWSPNAIRTELVVTNPPPDRLQTELEASLDAATGQLALPPEAVDVDEETDPSRVTVGFEVPGSGNESNRALDYTLAFVMSDLTSTALEVNTNLPFSGATIDAQADLLPPFESAVVDPGPRPIVTWMASNRMSAADGLLALLSWQSAVGARRWAMVVPPGMGTAIQAPELPDELAAQGPTAQITQFEVTMMGVEASYYADYDALRAQPIHAFSDLDGLTANAEYTRARTVYNLLD